MTPELWDILKFLVTVGSSILASWWLFVSTERKTAIEEKKQKNDNELGATETAKKALEVAQAATNRAKEEADARKIIEEKLDKVLDTLSGTHRLSVDFEMRDLLQNGRAMIREGYIEVVKITRSEIPVV